MNKFLGLLHSLKFPFEKLVWKFSLVVVSHRVNTTDQWHGPKLANRPAILLTMTYADWKSYFGR